jgi:hypothetical protein
MRRETRSGQAACQTHLVRSRFGEVSAGSLPRRKADLGQTTSAARSLAARAHAASMSSSNSSVSFFIIVPPSSSASTIPRHVVADVDGDQLHLVAALDVADHLAQVLLQVIPGVHRQRRFIDRRAVADHQHNTPMLRTRQQAAIRPQQRLAADVLLQQTLERIHPDWI